MKKYFIFLILIIVIAILLGAIFYCHGRESNKGNLTLEDINNLVTAKGDKLTWNDFEQYPSIEIGSGLYILLYEIDANYDLRIGGVPDKEPMYIRFTSKKDTEKSIDIRYDNVDEFLEENE